MHDSKCVSLQSTPNPVFACPGTEASVTVDLVPDLPTANAPGIGTLKRLDDQALSKLSGFSPAGGTVSFYQLNVLNNYRYAFSFERPEQLPNELVVSFAQAPAGQWITLELPVNWATVNVYSGTNADEAHRLQKQPTLAALLAGTSGFRQLPSGITLKLQTGQVTRARVCRLVGCK